MRHLWQECARECAGAIRLYRIIFAILTLLAIGVQLLALLRAQAFNAVNFFSYFTIESNLIGATLLLVSAGSRDRLASLDFFRGGAVVYMSATGIVFTLLLSGTDVDTAIPWVNTVVHELMPLILVADWLLDPPHRRLTLRQGLIWLSFPLAWIMYTLIRGSITGRYPYPFLNPANGGYTSIAAHCIAILVLMAMLCAAVVWLANTRNTRLLRNSVWP